MSQGISDGDLVRLARDGDAVAFRLLVERHLPMARARARRLCANPSDVDDIVQESFLQAFLALDRLRDPDRFPGWLAGIVLIWLPGPDGIRISAIFERRNPEDENAGTIRDAEAKASTAEELTRQLLYAAGARVTSVDVDELGPGVPMARIGLTGPADSGNVTARLPDGLGIAITAGTQIRVADAVMDRLAVPASPDRGGLTARLSASRRLPSGARSGTLRKSGAGAARGLLLWRVEEADWRHGGR